MSSDGLNDGQSVENARSIVLTAVGSGRALDLGAPGVTTVLICFAESTQKGIEAPETAVRERWPYAADVLIAHVIDLTRVPGLFRSIAEGVLRSEHRKAVEGLADAQKAAPEDYVVMLPDWSGEVAKAFGIIDPNVAQSWIVISKNGSVAVIAGDAAGGYGELVAAVEKAHAGAADI